MNVRLLVGFVGLAALEACTGTGLARTQAPVAPASVVRSAMVMKPIVTDATGRSTTGVYGGSPAFSQNVDLYDAPVAGFSQVNIALTEVDAVSQSGTITPMQTYSQPMVVNLLSLQTSPLAIGGTIAGGNYVGLRLVGSAAQSSAVTTSGTTMPLTVSGASGSTFAVSVGVAFGPNSGNAPGAVVSLDFNLAESIASVDTALTLQPLLVAQPSAGKVQGTIVNRAGNGVPNASVAVVDGNGRTVNTTITSADGSFTVHALPYGTYQLAVYNAYQNAAGRTFTAANADNGAPNGPTFTVSSATTAVGTVRD